MEVLNRVKDDFELAVVRSSPAEDQEGRRMIIVLILRRNSKAVALSVEPLGFTGINSCFVY